MTTFLSDIVLAGANDIQFKNTSGTNTGKIESDGNNLVLSNAVGDILLGDGASDVYIGDGTNSVDILFEQSGSIKAEDGSSGVTLTLGSGDTTLALGSSISSTLTVGVDDTGHDVKFFGATSGKYLHWDESEDYLLFTDSTHARFGNGGDLRINHNGTDSFITNHVGDFKIIQHADDKDIIFQSDDGSGGVGEYFRLDGSNGLNRFFRDVRLGDSIVLNVGSSDDLKIYHDGSKSLIQNETGNLEIIQNADDSDIKFFCDNGSGGTTTYFMMDGSTVKNLFFVNTDFGADDTGVDVTFYGATSGRYMMWDESADKLLFRDNVQGAFGNADDLRLFHSGTNSFISNYTGDLIIEQKTVDKDIIFKSDDGSGGETAYLTLDGSAAETKVDKDMRFSDNVNLRIGTNSDVVIVHDNSNFTTTNYTGNYNIINEQVDGDIVFQTDDGSGGVETYLTIDGGSQEIIATKPIVTGETQIKVLPHHFMSNEDGGANKSAQFRDDTIIGVRTSADSAELYAFVDIPYGKTARTVTVYGNDTSLVVNVFKSDINAGALTDITNAGGCVVGTECDIVDTAYSATNYLVIKVTTVSYTNDIVYGAVVTIG